MGGLKVRYQHGSGGDAEGFKARAALLAQDLADAPADLLRVAVAAWVRESPFMPTAADLTRLMREELDRRDEIARPHAPEPGHDPAQAFCDQRNAAMESDPNPRARKDIEWVLVGGSPQLQYKRKPPYDRGNPDRCDPAAVARLNTGLQHVRASFRFNANGYPFDL